ncbi:MAG TPA: DNA-3-methyladenine glycosylase [Verrucomicrobiae bacterium]|nr:DNA-3-methyladenine glycosylase [Verrucomicrobiae bacterium]
MHPDLTDSLRAARSLLGYELVHQTPESVTAGIIVETEAYDMHDPASHSFGGVRRRNAPMYQAAGTVYVYLIYGIHYCVNIVTGPEGHGQAVLIRALQPTQGIPLMQVRRRAQTAQNLTNGPAKAAQALGITAALNGSTLGGGPLSIRPGVAVDEIVETTRVGISRAVDKPWRFYIRDNPYVSRF